MGDVWLAEQQGPRGFRRQAVIKRIHSHLADDENFTASFEDEARLAAQLDHPNIARVEDYGEADGVAFIVMEYVKGWDLRQLSQRAHRIGRKLPLKLVLKVFADVAHALHYAHHAVDLDGHPLDVVHRDVSPHNIMVMPSGRTKLLDFGVARSAGQQQITRTGMVKGKLSYLSPEQILSKPLDGRSDLFSLATVLYECLHGERLFDGENDLAILQQIASTEALAIPSQDRWPPELAAVMSRALSRRPEGRFESCGDFAMALEACLEALGGAASANDLQLWLQELGSVDLEPRSAATADRNDDQVTQKQNASLQGLPPALQEPQQTGPSSPFAAGSWTKALSVSFTAPLDLNQSNLPRHMTRFVGRADEVDQLEKLLEADHRLITIVGPGGMGKSRLSIHYAARHLIQYSGGGWFVDLSRTKTLDGILAATGAALSVPMNAAHSTEECLQQLGHAMAGRGPILLLFDNFEQLVSEAEACFPQWLQMAPQARFLVTSQRRLGLRAETIFDLDPLRGEQGLELFAACARKARKGFTLQKADRPIVEEIIEQLDGIPLAIELAAARVAVLPPRKLLSRLNKRFQLLQSRDQDLSDRQRTLQAAIDWSWGLLEPWEQEALAQCSIFQGGFSLESAEEIIDLSQHPDAPFVMDVILNLKDRSLLRSWELPELPDELRFGMYESVRLYAGEKLKALETLDSVRAAHAEWILRYGEHLAKGIESADALRCLDLLSIETDNLLAVESRFDDEHGIRATLISFESLYMRGAYAKLKTLVDRAVERARHLDDPALLIRALDIRCRLSKGTENSEAVIADAAEGLRLAEEGKDRRAILGFLVIQAWSAIASGAFQVARDLLDQATDLADQLGDPRLTLLVLDGVANEAFYRSDLKRAGKYFQAYRDLAQEQGFERLISKADISLGWLLTRLGRFEEAETTYRNGLEVAVQFRDLHQELLLCSNLGTMLSQVGRPDEGIELYDRGLELARQLGVRNLMATLQTNVSMMQMAAGNLEIAAETLDEITGTPDLRIAAWVDSLRGLLAGIAGDHSKATATLGAAVKVAKKIQEPIVLALAELCHGGMDLSQAQLAHDGGDHAACADHLNDLESRIEKAQSPLAGGDDAVAQRSPAEQEGDIRTVITLLQDHAQALQDIS